MLLRLASDLHTEWWDFNKFERLLDIYLPPLSTDAESILCLGGDCISASHWNSTAKPLFSLLSKRFKHILYVYGNHFYYNTRAWNNEKAYWGIDRKIPKNVTILKDSFKVIGNVVFIGATLWTGFNNSDTIAMMHAKTHMNDYECIRMEGPSSPYSTPGIRLTPEMTVESHNISKQFIFETIKLFRENRTIVITHHLPSEQSCDKSFAGDILNHAYFTELGEDIAHCGPDIWLHGHTHSSAQYMIGNTQIECNPLGYHGHSINKDYIKDLVIEV